jgi:hypothetical protein
VSKKINPSIEQNSASITSELVALMALGTGSIVANIQGQARMLMSPVMARLRIERRIDERV